MYDTVQAKDKYKERREKGKEEKKDSDRERYRKKESDKASERAKERKRKKEKERERSQTRQSLIICWLMIKRHAVARRHAVVDLSFIYLNQIRVCGLGQNPF